MAKDKGLPSAEVEKVEESDRAGEVEDEFIRWSPLDASELDEKEMGDLGNVVMSRLMDFPGNFRVDALIVKANVIVPQHAGGGYEGEHDIMFVFGHEKITDPTYLKVLIDQREYPVPGWITDVVMDQVIRRLMNEAGIVDQDLEDIDPGPEPEEDEPGYEQDESVAAALAGTPLGGQPPK